MAAILDFSKCSRLQFWHPSVFESIGLEDIESAKTFHADLTFGVRSNMGFLLCPNWMSIYYESPGGHLYTKVDMMREQENE